MRPTQDCCNTGHAPDPGRRAWLTGATVGATAMVTGLAFAPGTAGAESLSRQQRDAMSPDDVIEMLRAGNARFRSGTMRSQDFLAQKRASVSGQYPAAVILSCIDSRAPSEIILDAGIGDVFGARIAGNIATADLIGSMEFACAVAGAKLLLVMGHTGCGAIAGAIDKVRLGNLSGLLDQIRPAVDATEYAGERSGGNPDFVNAVAHTHVIRTIDLIRRQSPVLAALESAGTIKMAGAMYRLDDGQVTFIDLPPGGR